MPRDLHITDHAIVRWIERVYGVDIDDVRDDITRACAGAASAGATKISAHGVTIVLKHDSVQSHVVTVQPAESPNQAMVGGLRGNGKHPNSLGRMDCSRAEFGRWQRRAARGMRV